MEPRIQYAQSAERLRSSMDAVKGKHIGLGLMLASTQLHPYVGST